MSQIITRVFTIMIRICSHIMIISIAF